MSYTADSFPKHCKCGLTYDKEMWIKLPFRGVFGDLEMALELRDCECKSTIAVKYENGILADMVGAVRGPTYMARKLDKWRPLLTLQQWNSLMKLAADTAKAP